MSTLRQLFYVSRVAESVGERDVRNILAISRRNNRMLDVTGCLSCSGRHFAQILEGRDVAIDNLMGRIARDPRHSDFRLVLDRPIVLREHPLWSMAYRHDPDPDETLEGLFTEPLPALRESLRMMVRLKPDTVMGAL
ncbi:MAG TPA: BLUF domain-containing protein [Caldimonas sp.]